MDGYRNLRRRRLEQDTLMFDRPRTARGVVPLLVMGGLAAAGTIGAAALSANAASSQARAARNADRETRNFTRLQYQLGHLNQLVSTFGGAEGIRRFRAMTPEAEQREIFGAPATDPNFTRDQQEALRELTERRGALQAQLQRSPFDRPGDSSDARRYDERQQQIRTQIADIDNQLASLNVGAGGDAGSLGLLREEDILGLRGIAEDYDKMAEDADRQGMGNLAAYDIDSNRLSRQARDIEAQSRRFGQGQTERARRDAAESLRGANQAATASMMARGLGGSSALMGALNGNATQNQRALADVLGGLEDSQIRMQTGLAGNRLGLNAQRAQGRTGVMLAGQDVTRGLQMGALNLRNNALTGPSSNPWLENGVPAFSAASPSAAASGAWASALGGIGGQGLGYSMGGLMDYFGRPGGGGGGGVYDSTRLPYAGRAG